MPKHIQILVFSLGLLIMFGLFGNKANTTPEENFWAWFQKNESRIFNFEIYQEQIFDEVASNIKKVNPSLTIEITRILSEGKREFVISADGDRTAFPAVELLYKQAPPLERWTWVKYRPRMSINNIGIKSGEQNVSAEDVNFLLFSVEDKDKVGIMLFFDGFNEENKNILEHLGFVLLDTALGEYTAVTQVEFVEFESRESKYFPESMPLNQLQAQFDEYFERKVH